MDGQRLKHMAPLIFLYIQEQWCARKVAQNDAWVDQISMTNGLTMAHIHEFIALWTHVSQVVLHDGRHDTITWKLTGLGRYSMALAYQAQFLGTTTMSFKGTICEELGPAKVQVFVWLTMQTRVG